MAKSKAAATKTATKAPTKTAAKVVIIPAKAATKAPVKVAKPVATKTATKTAAQAPAKVATKAAPKKEEVKVTEPKPQLLHDIERISVPSADGKFLVIETGFGSKEGYRKEYIADIDPVDHGEGEE